MRTIPPAETFIINKLNETQPDENRPPKPKEVEEWMIEFAKMHVTEALKQASKKASIFKNSNSGSFLDAGISKDSILLAYDLNNVE